MNHGLEIAVHEKDMYIVHKPVNIVYDLATLLAEAQLMTRDYLHSTLFTIHLYVAKARK